MKMPRTWRTVGFGLVILLALSTGWIVERAVRFSHPRAGAATSEPAKPKDAVRPTATDQEYDRSDLILSRG